MASPPPPTSPPGMASAYRIYYHPEFYPTAWALIATVYASVVTVNALMIGYGGQPGLGAEIGTSTTSLCPWDSIHAEPVIGT